MYFHKSDYNGEELDETTANSVNEVLAAVSATETVTSGDQAVTMVTVGNSQMPVISVSAQNGSH